jgi:predicted transcriptional regulator of viral defense system
MPARLRAQAVSQAGVVSRKQALDRKMSRSAIRARVVSRRWQQVHNGVYAIFSGPLDRRAQLWAAVLYAGKGALLSHATAAELQNLMDERDPLIHVTVPHKRQVRRLPGVAVHRSDRFADAGLSFPEGELPRTGVEDTILDLVSGMGNVDDVCAIVARAFARSLTSGSSCYSR